MSAWRRVALQVLPEYRRVITEADNPMAMWIELLLEFENLYRHQPLNDDLVRRFYDYARWCLDTKGDMYAPDGRKYASVVATAAMLAFYEHLPLNEQIRCDLPRWLSREEFHDLAGVFRYHLSEEQFADYAHRFLASAPKQRKGRK